MYVRLSTWEGDLQPLLDAVDRLGLSPNSHGYAIVPIDIPPVIKGDVVGSMVVVVWPNGQIIPHDASVEKFTAGATRHHVVLKTNDQSWSMHDDYWQRLQLRGIYTVDPWKIHAAVNWGKECRIHLIVDTNDAA